MSAFISLRFPRETKPIGVTIQLSLDEAWEILREQHRIYYHDELHHEHKGQPGCTGDLMERLRATLIEYPDPNCR